MVNPDRTTTVISDPNVGPYDGGDDTLVGIENNSSQPVPAITAIGPVGLFGFDGDGLCTFPGAPSSCSSATTGYEGPGTSFVTDPASSADGEIDFAGSGLAAHAHTYFSLETAVTAAFLHVHLGHLQPPGPIDGFLSFLEGLGNGNICWKCVGGVIQALFLQPVNTASGNFTATYRDIAIPGRGLPIDFNRTYNSLVASTDGPLGFGWTFSYGASLTEDPTTGNVTIHQENASQVTFTSSGGGQYSTAPRFMATLVKNADGSFTFVRQQREKMVFSAVGQLLTETDLNGNITTLAHDSKGRLAAVTDAAGRSVKLGYDGSSHLKQLTDPMGRSVTFGYDASGNLKDVEDVKGNHSRFTYDAQHRMLTMTDPKGGTVTNHYDATNRVDSQSDELGRKTSFAYAGDNTSSAGGTTTVTDPKGNVTVEQYQFGERVAETKGFGTPQAATTTLTYDPATVGVTSVTDPNGHATLSTYDAHGNPLTVTDPLGRATVNTYDTLDDLTSTTDPKNVTTMAAYDTRGNLLSKARPLAGTGQSQVTTYHHDDPAHPGDVTSMTDADAQTWKYGHDIMGNVTSTTDPLGDKATSAFNVLGWVTSTVSPKGNVTGVDRDAYRTTIEHNRFGQVTDVTDPLGHETVSHYDANGNLVDSRDGNGNTTRYTYDAANEPTGTIRPDGTTLATDYNADGTVFHQYDGKHNATTYGYDPLARATSVADPLGRTTTSTYDGAGNLQTVTDPQAQVASYSYDPANQLASIAYSDGTTPGVSNLTYDADGQRLTMTDGTGTSTYKYDSLNRLTSSTDGAGNVVKYGYDLKGQLIALTYPGGNVVTRGFDPAGRLNTVTDWLGHATKFGYDPNSNPTTEKYPAATHNVATSSYDTADRLMGIANTHGDNPFATFTYKRDGANQLTTSSATGVDQPSQEYDYTKLNQLAGAEIGKKNSGHTVRYGYDPADNITALPNGSTLTYDAANQLQTTTKGAGVTQFTYDQRGNRTSQTPSVGPSATYTYDQVNRLTALNGATYSYNGDGLRMGKTVAGVKTHFVWDVAEGLPRLLQESTPAGQTNYVYGANGLPLEQITGNVVSYYHHDQLGSTRVLTGADGKVQATYTYDPYGNLRASDGTTANPLRFCGEYQDAESGLYYLRARYYDTATAQFVSRDPAVVLTGSPYAYVGGDPLNATDPSGLCWGPGCWVQEQLNKHGLCTINQSNCGNSLIASAPGVAAAGQWVYQHEPDYATASVGIGIPLPNAPALNVGLQFTISKDLHGYGGWHAGAGTPGPSAFLGVGVIDPGGGPVSECERDQFISGAGVSLHGQVPVYGWVGPGGSVVNGRPGENVKHGYGVEGGVGLGVGASSTYSYNTKLW